MELLDVLSDFLSDKPEMKHLLTIDGKAFVNYLTDVFLKLNILNKQLQETKMQMQRYLAPCIFRIMSKTYLQKRF